MKLYVCLVFLLLLLAGSHSLRAQTTPGNPVLKKSVNVETVSYQGMTMALPASRDYAALRIKPTGKRVEYDLTVAETMVNITGKPTQGMTLNGTTPGPTLAFTEGDTAVIRVHNTLKTETSIHWHGILVPNRQDGVAYLNTPPIGPGQSLTFEFPIVQSGTYWYHSHTPFQEQRGVYGPIVIQPQRPTVKTDHELVLMLADWTDEKPAYVVKNLKRRTEWYAIKKGNVQPLSQIIRHRALGAYLTQSFNRMPPMDISDVYYQRFLINGKDTSRYEEFKPGETVRLRVINAAGASYFNVQFAGGPMRLIAADGIPVQPVSVDRMLMAIAETYDFIVTIPASGAYELRASAQDGSGYASAFLGKGKPVFAPKIPKPDLYQMTKAMSKMPGGNRSGLLFGKYKPLVRLLPPGTPAIPEAAIKMSGMDMPGMKTVPNKDMPGMDMPGMDMPDKAVPKPDDSMKDSSMEMPMFDKFNTFDYKQLRSIEKTVFPANRPVREVTLNLSGDMRRYIWGFNGKTLSGADAIAVRRGEVVRFRLVNATMMFHPLHLHGHFFRVLNGQGDYSPLKHTLNLSPMETVVIEFLADEENDWFFHCHILYHLVGGMGQVVHYEGTTPDADIVAARNSPASPMKDPAGDKKYYFWGQLDAGYPTSYLALNYSNQRNAFIIGADVNRRGQFELDADYERYLSQYLRVFGGIDAGNEQFLRRTTSNRDVPPDQRIVRAVAGVRYLLPFLIDSEVKVDARGNVRFQLSGEQQLFSRVILSYQAQWLVSSYTRLRVDLDYLLTKNIALFGNYDTRYNNVSGGLSYRF
ncbi:MAG: multicopper oxidase domain-containing protein [Rudanella sp.]|nr:multicopper oxidase domain-containing protein [Rudanella sp.]